MHGIIPGIIWTYLEGPNEQHVKEGLAYMVMVVLRSPIHANRIITFIPLLSTLLDVR